MKGKVFQLISAFIISIGNFLFSFSIVWPSYTLELLKSQQSPVGRITSTDCSLVGSLPMLGLFAGVLVTGFISDKIGRKLSCIIYGLCFVLSWTIKANSTSIGAILIARFTVGFGSGLHFLASLPFINELSHASIRGTTTTFITFSYNFGILISYLCGWMLSYNTVIYLSITLGTIYVVLLSFLEETPSFLLRRGKEKKALKSLRFYRGTKSVADEMEYLKSQTQNETVPSKTDAEHKKEKLHLFHEEKIEFNSDMSAWKILWTSKPTQRALMIITIQFILLVFGGSIAVETYAAPLFTAAAPNMSAHACSVCLALAFLLGSMFALVLSDILGRRTQMISSSILCTWWLAVLASLLRWSWGPEWMIPAAVLAFAFSYQFGVAIIPFMQLSECFVPKMKSLSMTVSLSIMCIANFILLAVFDTMVSSLGLDYAFVTFAAVYSFSALFTYIFMKETRGVPIEDILAMYEKGFLFKRKSGVNKGCDTFGTPDEGVTESLADAIIHEFQMRDLRNNEILKLM